MNIKQSLALVVVTLSGALAPRIAHPNAFDSFGGVQGRDLITMNVIPAARRWTNNAFTWDYNPAGAPAALAGLTNAQIRTAMNNWAGPININLAAAPGAVSTQEIRISWTNTLAAGTLASTGATFGAGQINFSTIRFNNNAALNWSITGFQNTLQHEFGHSLGLVDSYNNNINTVVDFIDHQGGGDAHTGLAKGNNDNVMYGFMSANAAGFKPFDNDDIHGSGWLYGVNNRNTIATAAWKLALGSDPGLDGAPGGGDDYTNYYQVDNHHGSDDPAPRNWFYKGTIGAPDPVQTIIEIPAKKVTAHTYAMGGGNAGWSSNYDGTRLQFIGPAGFTGNFDVTLVSTLATEGLVTAKVNATTFSDLPFRNGPQNAPKIWAPVPEPGTAALFAIALASLSLRSGRKRRR